MRFARRAPLVVVLLLLASFGTASGECAWVAWNSIVGGGFDMPGHRLAAFSQRAECLAYVRARARSIPMAKEAGSKVYEAAEGAQVEMANGRVSYFECWPDTIDPRGPKAK